MLDGNRLGPGQHVTGIIGSNKQLVEGGFLKKPRREIDDATAAKADVIVTNLKESMVSEEQGDLFGPIQRGLIGLEDVLELGDFATGQHPGRTSDDQITIADLTGVAVQDIQIAKMVARAQRER